MSNFLRVCIEDNIILYHSTRMSDLSPESASVFPSSGTKRGGGQASLAGEGAGGANSDDWRESLALCVLGEYVSDGTGNV
jgi:hypothetical protein